MFLHKAKTLIFSVIFLDNPVVWLSTLKFVKNNHRIISKKNLSCLRIKVFVYLFVDNTDFGNNEFSLKAHKKHQTECVGEDEFIMNLLFFENSNILSSEFKDSIHKKLHKNCLFYK